MGLFDSLKRMFAAPPKRKDGVSLHIHIPPPSHISFCHRVEQAAKQVKLTGWVALTPEGDVKAEFEGERAVLESFLRRLETGQIIPGKIVVNMRWLPYRGQYTTVQ